MNNDTKTSLQMMIDAGIRFSFCRECMMPEIPRVQDVLFALGLAEEQEFYDMCFCNHEPYVQNVHLVLGAITCDLMYTCFERDEQGRRRLQLDKAEKLIASAIIDLCPEEARCFFVTAFCQAKQALGEEIPLRQVSAEEIRQDCGCKHCQQPC